MSVIAKKPHIIRAIRGVEKDFVTLAEIKKILPVHIYDLRQMNLISQIQDQQAIVYDKATAKFVGRTVPLNASGTVVSENAFTGAVSSPGTAGDLTFAKGSHTHGTPLARHPQTGYPYVSFGGTAVVLGVTTGERFPGALVAENTSGVTRRTYITSPVAANGWGLASIDLHGNSDGTVDIKLYNDLDIFGAYETAAQRSKMALITMDGAVSWTSHPTPIAGDKHAPAAGQGRIYYDLATGKLKVSENGGLYVNLVAAAGPGGGTASLTVTNEATFAGASPSAGVSSSTYSMGDHTHGSPLPRHPQTGYPFVQFGGSLIQLGVVTGELSPGLVASENVSATVRRLYLRSPLGGAGWGGATFDLYGNLDGTSRISMFNDLDQNLAYGDPGTGSPSKPLVFELTGNMTFFSIADTPPVAVGGTARLYYKSTTGRMQISENGGAFKNLGLDIGSSVNGTFLISDSAATDGRRWTANTEVIVTAVGVGIGVAIPTQKLTVAGLIAMQTQLKIENTASDIFPGLVGVEVLPTLANGNQGDRTYHTSPVRTTAYGRCSLDLYGESDGSARVKIFNDRNTNATYGGSGGTPSPCNVELQGYWAFKIIASTPPVSHISSFVEGSSANVYYDGTTGKVKISENGSAYRDLSIVGDVNSTPNTLALRSSTGGSNFKTITLDSTSAELSILDRDQVSNRWAVYALNSVLRLWEGGTGDKFYFTTGGRLGIGTTPASVYLIHAKNATQGLITVESTTGTPTDVGFRTITPQAEWTVGQNLGGGNSGKFMINHTAGGTRVYIDTSGFVGVGIIPTSKLHVDGNITLKFAGAGVYFPMRSGEQWAGQIFSEDTTTSQRLAFVAPTPATWGSAVMDLIAEPTRAVIKFYNDRSTTGTYGPSGVNGPLDVDISGNLTVSGTATYSNGYSMPYAGSDPGSGPAVRWTDSTMANTLGLYVNAGLNYQGNSGNPHFNVRLVTGTSSLGAVAIQLGATDATSVSYFNAGAVGFGTTNIFGGSRITSAGYVIIRDSNAANARYRASLNMVANYFDIQAYDDTGAVLRPINIQGSIISLDQGPVSIGAGFSPVAGYKLDVVGQITATGFRIPRTGTPFVGTASYSGGAFALTFNSPAAADFLTGYIGAMGSSSFDVVGNVTSNLNARPAMNMRNSLALSGRAETRFFNDRKTDGTYGGSGGGNSAQATYEFQGGDITTADIGTSVLQIHSSTQDCGIVIYGTAVGFMIKTSSADNNTSVARFRNTDNGSYAAIRAGNVYGNDVLLTSARSLKRNIKPLAHGALESINKLRPVSFEWNETEKILGLQTGFIADEIHQAIPRLAKTEDGSPSHYNLSGLVATLVKAIQELTEKVQVLENA